MITDKAEVVYVYKIAEWRGILCWREDFEAGTSNYLSNPWIEVIEE